MAPATGYDDTRHDVKRRSLDRAVRFGGARRIAVAAQRYVVPD
jgi:hypothetical protein